MVFRFKKSIKILPGFRLNFSKGGMSTSLGGNGVTLNFSKKGKRTTFGLPTTGISFSRFEPIDEDGDDNSQPETLKKKGGCWNWVIGFFALSLLGQCFLKPPNNQGKALVTETENSSNSKIAPKIVQTSNTVSKPNASNGNNYPQGSETVIAKKTIEVYEAPSSIPAPNKSIHQGEKFSIIEKKGDWAKIVQNGLVAWILLKELSSPPESKITNDNPEPQTLLSKPKGNPNLKSTKSITKNGSRCACGTGKVCIGPRGGRYCITSTGNKSYGK